MSLEPAVDVSSNVNQNILVLVRTTSISTQYLELHRPTLELYTKCELASGLNLESHVVPRRNSRYAVLVIIR